MYKNVFVSNNFGCELTFDIYIYYGFCIKLIILIVICLDNDPQGATFCFDNW